MRFTTNLNNTIRHTEPSYLIDNEKVYVRDVFEGNLLLLLNKYGITPKVSYDYGFEWKFTFIGMEWDIHEDKGSDDMDIFYYSLNGDEYTVITMDLLLNKIEYLFNKFLVEDFINKNKNYEFRKGGSYNFQITDK